MQLRRRPAGAVVAAFLLAAPNVGAQQATVTGRVTDQQSGNPMAAAQVFLAEANIGGLSQQDGRFLLLNVPAGTYTLTVQRIGYRTVTEQVAVAADETLVRDFALTQEALGLDEIIVTGTPGGTQRRAIGNAVTSVRAAEVTEAAVVTDMQSLLAGRAPGVQFARVGGVIGTGSDIEVRGVGTFSLGRNPLIFVDGVRVNNSSEAGPQLGNRREVNVFNDFNPDDIESIEIIKGPAAATLYGTEASAGVIQIITKRGAQGAPEFTMSVAQGVNFIRDPRGRMGTQWTCRDSFNPPCLEDDGRLVPYNMVDELNYMLHAGTYNPEWNHDHWPQKNLFQYGPSRSYNLGVRGGTETVRYFLSGSHDYDEGAVYYNWNEALRLRANVGVVFSDYFSLDVSTGYVQGDSRFSGSVPAEGGEWEDMAWGNGYCAPRIGEGGPECTRLLGMQEHLPTDVAKVRITRDYQRFTGSGTLNFTAGGWLSSRAIVGIDRGWDENVTLHPVETVQSTVYQRTVEGEVAIERPIHTEVTLDWSATANLGVTDSWSTATSVGAQYYSRTEEMLGTIGEGFASPLSTTVNQTPASRATLNYQYVDNKTLGFFVQEQLSWNDRLFLTGALRFDDNSAFGAELEPKAYPKLSGTWVVSEEEFWNVALVSSLRLRGAWGQAGRQPSTFANTNTYNTIAGPGGTAALDPASSGNVEVGPERSTELELGFDVAVVDGRLAGDFTWYTQRNEDALLGVALPPSIGGGGSIQRNIGRIDNWGWEASLNARVYDSPRFGVSLDLTASHTDNEIKELGDFPGNNDIRIGWQFPVQSETRYWVVAAEYDPDGPIVDAWGRRIQAYCDSGVRLGDTGQHGYVRGGEVVPCQEIGDYRISAGPAFYPYRFSVTPTFSLLSNALRVHVLMDGAYGKIGLDGVHEWSHRYNSSYDSRCECDPRWVAGDRLASMATWGNFDADFWKLREVGVRYAVPASVARRIGADRAAVSFSGRELAILWQAQNTVGIAPSAKDTGNPGIRVLDPEMGQNNSGNVANHRLYPPNTSLHIRFDVTF